MQKKKIKRSIILVASLICLLTIASIMAYFTVSDEATNRLTSKTMDILLTETKWNAGAGRNIVPDEVLDKNPEISNLEETDVYVFLKVTVPYLPNVTLEYSEDTGSAKKGADRQTLYNVPLFKFITTDADGNNPVMDETFTSAQAVHKCWKLLNSYPEKDETKRTYTYVYAYTDGMYLKRLPQMETTEEPLFDQIKLINFDEYAFLSDQTYSVQVKAYGIQADHLVGDDLFQTPEIVWDVINTE